MGQMFVGRGAGRQELIYKRQASRHRHRLSAAHFTRPLYPLYPPAWTLTHPPTPPHLPTDLEHLAPNLLELHLAPPELQAQLDAVPLAQELLGSLHLDLHTAAGRQARRQRQQQQRN